MGSIFTTRNHVIVALICVCNFRCEAKPVTLKKWEKCRDKVESSVNQMEIGIWGVEAAIKSRCGDPPAQEPSLLTGTIGMHPYDLVRSKTWKNKFEILTQKKYHEFVDRLTVAEKTTINGNWIIGKGIAPHSGGSDQAIFLIDVMSGRLYAAMIENGAEISRFGFSSIQEAPPLMQNWINELGAN